MAPQLAGNNGGSVIRKSQDQGVYHHGVDSVTGFVLAGGGWQPRCAVYRRDFTEVAQRLPSAGKNKVDALFGEVPTLVIGQTELEREGFGEVMLRNLNTEQDWQEAKQKLSAE